MRVKKPAKGREPNLDDDENDELVWARLRERASADSTSKHSASEVVARAVHTVGDPYSSYADYVQQEAGGAYVDTQAQQEEDEDDPELWERLRANASHGAPRTSDVAPRGSHEAWETENVQGGGYAAQAHYYAEQEAQYYAQQQQQAEQQQEYAQQQAEAEYYAQQQAAYAQQQAEAEYYAQQQQAQQYAQQQQAQQYAQQQQAQQYAQQHYAQQPYQPAPSFAQGPSPYAAAPAGYAEQPSWQQQPASHASLDDTFETTRRGGGMKWLGRLVVLGGLAAGGVVGYPHVMQQLKPATLAPASMTALPMAAPSEPARPLGLEEARARDAIFGTHTVPPAPAASAVTPAPAEPSEVAAAEPAAPPPAAAAPAAAAPEPEETKFSALTGTAPGKKGGKKAKGKAAKKAAAASKLAAASKRKAAPAPAAPKAKRARSGGGNLAGGENNNDPLMGI